MFMKKYNVECGGGWCLLRFWGSINNLFYMIKCCWVSKVYCRLSFGVEMSKGMLFWILLGMVLLFLEWFRSLYLKIGKKKK